MSFYSEPMVHFCLADMKRSMKAVAQLDIELTVEERNLLSVAYNNAIRARRASWKILSCIEEKEEQIEDHPIPKIALIKTYRETVSEQNSRDPESLGGGLGVLN